MRQYGRERRTKAFVRRVSEEGGQTRRHIRHFLCPQIVRSIGPDPDERERSALTQPTSR